MKKFLKQGASMGGRAQRAVNSDVATVARSMLTGITSMIQHQPTDVEIAASPDLVELLKPVCFGIAKGKSTISYEASLLGTFRMSLSGTRTVTMAPLVPCVSHLVSLGATEAAVLADMDASFGHYYY